MIEKQKGWTIENFLEARDGGLSICGVSAVKLAEKFKTPLFVFSEQRIKHNINLLKEIEEVIDCPLKICYAAKANSNMAILRVIRDAGCDLEVNSGGELWKALKIGFTGEQIIFNGTSKEVWEIEDAINAGIYAIQVDSLLELSLIEETARKLDKRANVSLRLVPEIETKTHSGLQTALLTSKFGMMPDEALSAFHIYKDSKFLNLCGIHLHIGSQNPESEPYADALRMLFENLLQIYGETGIKLSHLNLGGGFPVNYLRDNSLEFTLPPAQRDMFSADFAPAEAIQTAWLVVKATAERANALNLLENITLLIEPGRSVIADAGICLTSVRNIKDRPLKEINAELNRQNSKKIEYTDEQKTEYIDKQGRRGRTITSFGVYGISRDFVNPKIDKEVWLLTDAGFNILLSMETYKWYYHLISATRAGEAHNFPYKLAGPLCDGGDVYFDIETENCLLGHPTPKRLPDYRLLPESVQLGEVLALLNCGAYSIAQMSQYNGRFLPAIVLIREDGEIELIRKRDDFADLITNEVF